MAGPQRTNRTSNQGIVGSTALMSAGLINIMMTAGLGAPGAPGEGQAGIIVALSGLCALLFAPAPAAAAGLLANDAPLASGEGARFTLGSLLLPLLMLMGYAAALSLATSASNIPAALALLAVLLAPLGIWGFRSCLKSQAAPSRS